ncbi:ATP-dependent zinc metalloprotease FtsH [Streptacidiphilus monticola]|uniref:ATP-dependent zinc metalloprotease FtsH n=1 Tax=Streptacidiphilus monticola TaxID=2161674 RepID=A0ABW1FWZ8_9ACTN
MDVKRYFRAPVMWIVLAVLAVVVLMQVVSSSAGYKTEDLSTVISQIDKGNASAVQLTTGDSQTVKVKLKNDVDGTNQIQATYPSDQWAATFTDHLTSLKQSSTVDSYTVKQEKQNAFVSILLSLLPFVLIVVVFLFLMNQMQGGGSRVMQFGKSKAKLITKDTPKTTFSDVAGADEAVEELQEIKEFLQEPAKFQAVGAKIPKGVLLYGPPGTGKTLLARAVAGEAGVPFYSISGSDFVEMFVGVGASRVRDLFEQAKANAPAIVFVDEIDAVGRHRGAGLGGGHDEREQTLNQLLVEMDGFDVKGGVILIAATNRPDILDPALLRPGRFDRQIAVDRPDLQGRLEILKVHQKGKPVAPDVDLMAVARRTPGFTGADLSNVLNEAALLTARSDKKLIDNNVLDEAIDRVVAGPQKRTRIMSDKEKKITAYHEGGHALVAAASPNSDPVHKVTILSRGRALGYTMVLPDEDKYSTTRNEMLDQLAYMMGGRAAEELVFHDPTTGASNDIEKATATARAMVTQYGMTERLGAIKFGTDSSEPFLGREMAHQRDYSEEVAALVDEEVKKLIENAHNEAWEILVENRDVLDNLVLELLDKETLNKEQLAEIFAPVVKRPPRPAWTGSARRMPSTRPPVQSPKELALANGSTDATTPSLEKGPDLQERPEI